VRSPAGPAASRSSRCPRFGAPEWKPIESEVPQVGRRRYVAAVNDRFSSSWRKIARARKHIDDLVNEIIGFWATGPYEIEEYGSPKTGPEAVRRHAGWPGRVHPQDIARRVVSR
jgi:hypothetical protein